MPKDESKPFAPPVYNGDEPVENAATKVTPFTKPTHHDRGKRAQPGTGAVVGSGAGAGGTQNGNEDYDDDDVGGGTRPPTGSRGEGSADRDPQNGSVAAAEEAHLPPGSTSL